ncbi:hypothetical protein CD127_06140 [Staphylococcus petrasii]|nr:hypothetical protein CD127_06140 [Staphylococcus petrasii]TGA81435.1 hypothetical protein E2554_07945 [Staphylococcus petrasii]
MRLKQAFSNLVNLAWWAGPQHRDFRKESLQTKQVGDTTKLVFNFCPTPSLSILASIFKNKKFKILSPLLSLQRLAFHLVRPCLSRNNSPLS